METVNTQNKHAATVVVAGLHLCSYVHALVARNKQPDKEANKNVFRANAVKHVHVVPRPLSAHIDM